MEKRMIDIGNVSKVYRLYEKPIDRLKELLLWDKKQYGKEFYALRQVNLSYLSGRDGRYYRKERSR